MKPLKSLDGTNYYIDPRPWTITGLGDDLPTSVAGRMEVIAAWLEGFPVLSESSRRNRP